MITNITDAGCFVYLPSQDDIPPGMVFMVLGDPITAYGENVSRHVVGEVKVARKSLNHYAASPMEGTPIEELRKGLFVVEKR